MSGQMVKEWMRNNFVILLNVVLIALYSTMTRWNTGMQGHQKTPSLQNQLSHGDFTLGDSCFIPRISVSVWHILEHRYSHILILVLQRISVCSILPFNGIQSEWHVFSLVWLCLCIFRIILHIIVSFDVVFLSFSAKRSHIYELCKLKCENQFRQRHQNSFDPSQSRTVGR